MIALAFYHEGVESNSESVAVRGLSLLLVLAPVPRDFSAGKLGCLTFTWREKPGNWVGKPSGWRHCIRNPSANVCCRLRRWNFVIFSF